MPASAALFLALASAAGQESELTFRPASMELTPREVALVSSPTDQPVARSAWFQGGTARSLESLLARYDMKRHEAWVAEPSGNVIVVHKESGPLQRMRAWASLYRFLENPANLRGFEAGELPAEIQDGLMVRAFDGYVVRLPAKAPLGGSRIAFTPSYRVLVVTPKGRPASTRSEPDRRHGDDWLREKPLQLLALGAANTGNPVNYFGIVIQQIAGTQQGSGLRVQAAVLFDRMEKALKDEAVIAKAKAIDAWRRAGLNPPGQQGQVRYSQLSDADKKSARVALLLGSKGEFESSDAVDTYLATDPRVELSVSISVAVVMKLPDGRLSAIDIELI